MIFQLSKPTIPLNGPFKVSPMVSRLRMVLFYLFYPLKIEITFSANLAILTLDAWKKVVHVNEIQLYMANKREEVDNSALV